jgi:hypothetical protein
MEALMRIAAWISIALLSLVVACGRDSSVETPPPPDTDGRPDALRVDREADEAALWLSGGLVAPQPLYETILNDLAAIRTEYGATVPDVAIEFQPWWTTSRIGVYVTADLRSKVLAHEPNPLDSLNTAYRAASMGTFTLSNSRWRTMIDFVGRQHPERLAEIYAAAPGVTGAFADSWLGDWSNAYPWKIAGGMSYLFRHGYGDCAVGCEVNDFSYFRRVGGTVEFVGSFRWGVDPYPEWWNEARTGFCQFMSYLWNGYCPP